MIIAAGATAQDAIYYTKNKIDKWKVTEINPQYIKAVDVTDPEMSYSTTLTNVLFLFNKNGDFLVVPKLYEDATNAEIKIKSFFQTRTVFHDFDKIITNKNEVIICTYENIENDKIIYKVNGDILDVPASKVVAIIFRSGEHKLFANAEKVYKTLSAVQQKYSELALAQQDQAADIATDSMQSDNSVARSDKPQADSQAVGLHISSTDTAVSTLSVALSDSARSGVMELEPSTISRLQGKAIANVRQLGDYIQVICQKDTEPEEISKTIEQALTLFITDARIEVSSINRSTVNQFKIRDYLIRMGMLKYQKVIVEWYDIQYTSQLRKGPDGFYYGTIEFEQRFVGVSADNAKYEDITRKSVEVVLKTYERNAGGKTTIEWDVFLGDIGVTVTKSA
jgi:hypothetical protein